MNSSVIYVIPLLLGLAWIFLVADSPDFKIPNGITVTSSPRQGSASGKPPWQKGKYSILPQASFELEARVVSSEHYWFDRGAGISPVDLLLAWGPMSDSYPLNMIDFGHGGRYYYSYFKKLPFGMKVMNDHIANMHMIPADDEVKAALKKFRRDDLIFLKGYLVNVRRADGWFWNTSMTRADSGAGACELIWVEEVRLR